MRVAIVGCGPAGLCAAIALHNKQFDVTLFEQFDQPGPVGSGLVLQPTGLAALEVLGLRAGAEQHGQRIDGMAFLDALALANALCRYPDSAEQAVSCYSKLRQLHVRVYQSVSYLLTPFYQSNSIVLPLLRDTFFEPVTSIGFMNRFVTKLGAGMLASPAAKLASDYRMENRVD